MKKGKQRLYFLRKLESFSINETILSLFYKSFIESVITFSFICWFQNLSLKHKNSIEKMVILSSKIIGAPQRSILSFYKQQCLRKARSILNSDHILTSEFQMLPSGRRFRCPISKTNRFKNSFIPTAVRFLNDAS